MSETTKQSASVRRWLIAAVFSLASDMAGAQLPAATDTAARRRQAPATTPAAVSGVIFGNYQYLLGGPREDFNQFVLDRAYLTVRGTPAPKLTYRLTSDVFQSGDGTGWAIRMKYAYLDYAIASGGSWATTIRAGMIQTVTIEHHETFWPRWLGTVPVDRAGYFQSADVGAAAAIGLPSGLGELYGHVVNGPGYTRREVDRFKDLGLRVTINPLSRLSAGPLRGLALTGWTYRGAVGGQRAADPADAPGLTRDRWGVHAGLKMPMLTVAGEHSRRTDDEESGGPLPTVPVTIAENTGSLTSGFAIVRPFATDTAGRTRPFGLVARYDHVDPSTIVDRQYHYLLAGALYDLNSRLSVSLNYQEQLGAGTGAPFRAVFTNFSVTF